MIEERRKAFTKIYETNHWGGAESRSGEGSSLAGTANIREALPSLLEAFEIKSILDIPCGDFHWMKEVKLGIPYTGIDIVPGLIKQNNDKYASPRRQFITSDAVVDPLPYGDLVFMRDFLQHLPNDEVWAVLQNILRTRARYLLVTSYKQTKENEDIKAGGYRPLNLFIGPFNLPRPILAISEGGLDRNEPDKAMYLFDLIEARKQW